MESNLAFRGNLRCTEKKEHKNLQNVCPQTTILRVIVYRRVKQKIWLTAGNLNTSVQQDFWENKLRKAKEVLK